MSQIQDQSISARGLLNYAQEYYNGYKIIYNEAPRSVKYFNVKYYLLCHALELAMKAWLFYKGYSIKKLESLGHDLDKIAPALQKTGYTGLDGESCEIIKLANCNYCSKKLEYFCRGAMIMPGLDHLAPLTGKILADIQPTILQR